MSPDRIREVTSHPVRGDGKLVLYWMTAYRRASWNHSLDRAIEHAVSLQKPLVVLEALRSDYRWASDRIHRFIIEGMADNEKAFTDSAVTYFPYVEPAPGDGAGLLETIAKDASVVVTDDFPCFFLPRMIAAAGRKLDAMGVRLEAVDGNGLYPMRHTDRVFTRAFDFRRHLQRHLPDFLNERPRGAPLRNRSLPRFAVPRRWVERFPPANLTKLLENAEALRELPIDHGVRPVGARGGSAAAKKELNAFVADRLERYDDDRNDPDADGASGLSPYLHFGHVSPHQVFWKIASRESWSIGELSPKTTGSRNDWWNASASAEAFFDQLITWRELGYNMCAHRDDYDRYESLPRWALQTLAAHRFDERPHLYTSEELDGARTHDPVWNAAQRQLVSEGRVQGYLRMLWGKKILHWTRGPEEALDIMIELNNKYALDGRNPNSYSGIFWTLGRYDRAWGPEREVFGKVRYMSSDNTRRKLRLRAYLDAFGAS